MRGFTRLLDLMTLGSDRPIRRLVAYYVFLGAVVFGGAQLIPAVEGVFQGVETTAGIADGQLLEDGLTATRDEVIALQPRSGVTLALSALLVMLGTLALMLPVSWVFMSARRAPTFDQSVVQTLLILPLVVAGIVLVVQTSLALAFSLAGIVAGLRLRTTIRDVRDTVYLFLGIGVGLAVGVQAWIVAAVLSITFNFVVLLVWRYDFGRKVLEPSAGAQWSGPLGDLAEKGDALSVPDRDLVLALSPKRAEALAKRFTRVSKILGSTKGTARFNAILTVTTEAISGAQERIEIVLDTLSRRWRLDEVTSSEGKPDALYYLVRVRKSITHDHFLTAIRESAGGTIMSAELEIGDALAQEKLAAK
jgi:hypothetical protein